MESAETNGRRKNNWAWLIGTIVAFTLFAVFISRPLVAQGKLMLIAGGIAYENHINIDHFFKVIDCESGWDPVIQSGYVLPDGRFEESWGIAQFNLDTNQMTRDEALDPEFSLRKMAEYWVSGNMSGWECYRLWDSRHWK
jgi:hypothetical protein